MRFVVVTLFPGVVDAYLGEGIVGRARTRGIFSTTLIDPRTFTTDKHRTVDDVPFGGGAGMVMKPEPVAQAIESAGPVARRIMLSPGGRPLTQADVQRYAALDSLLLLCGRYEGIDDRVVKRFVDEEVSLGDFVLSGGELAGLCILDAVVRLLPGALGNVESAAHESFSHGLLEHPHYTRPAEWRGEAVPEVLLSGHHAEIERWRRRESLRRTAMRRPEMLHNVELAPDERRFVDALLVNEESEK
jgi:tRNA (guanine37-N1)-methyltransferase